MSKEESSIGKYISVLFRCRKNYAGRMLEPFGLVGSQYLYILMLSLKNGASQEEISDHLKIDKTTTARSIKRLEDNGFIIRDIDTDDKRANKVYLTQKAIDILPEIKKTIKTWESNILSDISDDEINLLEKLLKKMADKAYSIS